MLYETPHYSFKPVDKVHNEYVAVIKKTDKIQLSLHSANTLYSIVKISQGSNIKYILLAQKSIKYIKEMCVNLKYNTEI